MRRLTLFALALAAMVFPSLALADPPVQEVLPNVHGPIVFDAFGGRTIISGSVTDMCAALSVP